MKTPLGHVVELRDAVGKHEGVMVRQTRDAGAEDDIVGQPKSLGDEEVGRGDVLPLRGEVLADPGLAVAQLVKG